MMTWSVVLGRGCVAAIVVASAAFSTVARAEEAPASDSAYCRHTRGRSESDAAILMWPQVFAQGIHFPTNGVDLTTAGRTAYQARVGVRFSPTDFYKGIVTKDVADADCAQHDVEISIEQMLIQVDYAGKLPALRKEGTYLDAHQTEWQAVAKKEEERFAAKVVSLVEFDGVRMRVMDLERRAAQVRGEADRLQAVGGERPRGTVASLERAYIARANERERRASHLRSVAPWALSLSGGAVPTDVPVDWFGLVELSFNVGAFKQGQAENKYLQAREEELKHARYEVVGRLHDFKVRLEGVRDQARRELAVLDRQVAMIASVRQTLQGSDAEGAGHALATLTLDQIVVEAEDIFLRSLADELTAYLSENRG
jgi:hypothetical protein